MWRALYFSPATNTPDAARSAAGPDLVHPAEGPDLGHSAEWSRGAYLVEGLGHCNACHSSRNGLGATAGPLDLAGGLMPVQNWYAPSLTSPAEAGVAAWDTQHIVDLLKTGVAAPGGARVAVAGPMSEVVSGGTQHLTDADLRAMANYLKALPQSAEVRSVPQRGRIAAVNDAGAKLYEQHCAQCHGEQGEGAAGIYPALAGNRVVAMHTPANLIHLVIEGGFTPATAGNPRPFGMPPFATVLSDDEVAQVLSFIRGSWGNGAEAVSRLEVSRYRSAR